MSEQEYPTRCEIKDIEGNPIGDTGLTARTPEISRQYIGQHGLAEKVPDADSIFWRVGANYAGQRRRDMGV